MPRVLPDDVFPTLGIVNPNWDMIDLHLIEPLLFDFSWEYGPMFSVNPVPRFDFSNIRYCEVCSPLFGSHIHNVQHMKEPHQQNHGIFGRVFQ